MSDVDGCAPDAPSAWVVAHAGAIASGGRVLDLACGRGRHARWLAAQGYRVLAADRDAEALAGLAAVDGVETCCCDLESGPWPFAEQRFGGIVVSRYLYRPLLSHLVDSLAAGGVLIYETFMLGNERFGRPTNPDFLLRPGELVELARTHDLEILDFAEGYQARPAPAMVQAICVRRRSMQLAVVGE